METTYRIVVTRGDGRWLAVVPGVPGARTAARSLITLERHVCQVIALLLALPPRAIHLVLEFRTGDGELDADLAAVRHERQRLTAAEHALAGPTGLVAERLISQHQVSITDTARILGLSTRRVSQLRPP
jgi:hypothetical protein